jgi:hypothetical protein
MDIISAFVLFGSQKNKMHKQGAADESRPLFYCSGAFCMPPKTGRQAGHPTQRFPSSKLPDSGYHDAAQD